MFNFESSLDDIFKRADSAMYEAKDSERNLRPLLQY